MEDVLKARRYKHGFNRAKRFVKKAILAMRGAHDIAHRTNLSHKYNAWYPNWVPTWELHGVIKSRRVLQRERKQAEMREFNKKWRDW